MMQYAQDAMETDKPWERWEYRGKWEIWKPLNDGFFPTWHTGYEYRRKPKPYEPTLLDQALELEIEASRLKANHFSDKIGDEFSIHAKKFATLANQRSQAMIEHLKAQGKL